MIIKLTKKLGIVLKTKKKYCKEDITVTPVLQNTSITKNGVYRPNDSFAGFGEVIVNVPTKVGNVTYISAEGVSF